MACGLMTSFTAGGVLTVSHQDQVPSKIHNYQQQPLDESGTMTVMSANIAGNRGRNFFFPHDLLPPLPVLNNEISVHGQQALEELIAKENISVACMQEIEQRRSENWTLTDQTAEIADHTQLKNYVFDPNIRTHFLGLFYFRDGNAIISSAPLQYSQREELEPYRSFGASTLIDPITGTKGVLHAAVNYKNSAIHFLCTHLSNWEMTVIGEEREQELEGLFSYAAKITQLTQQPVIIMGDLNTLPEDKAWQYIADLAIYHGVNVNCGLQFLGNDDQGQRLATYLGFVTLEELGENNTRKNNGKYIDYICTVNHPHNALNVAVTSLRPVHDINYSDHVPVIAEIAVSYHDQ